MAKNHTTTAPNDLERWMSLRRVLMMFVFTMLLLLAAFWDFSLAVFTAAHLEDNYQDFGRFFFSAKAFLSGDDMYGKSPGTAVLMNPLFSSDFWNLNPPHFHFLMLPLTHLSFEHAFNVWVVISLLTFLLSIYLIAKEVGFPKSANHWWICTLAILAFSGTGFVIMTVQVSFILLFPLTLAWIHARHNRWTQAGIYLGILTSMKMFFFIFLPYLILRRHLRAAMAFSGSVLIILVIGLSTFGLQNYVSWLDVLQRVHWAWGHTNASLFGLLTRSLTENPMFMPIATDVSFVPGWVISISLLGIITIAAATLDHSPEAVDRGFAILIFGAFLISPLAWIYYFFLPLGPFLSLTRFWWGRPRLAVCLSFPSVKLVRNVCVGIGLIGLFIPANVGIMFQPNPLATLFLASIYFWSTTAIWISIISDWRLSSSANMEMT